MELQNVICFFCLSQRNAIYNAERDIDKDEEIWVTDKDKGTWAGFIELLKS